MILFVFSVFSVIGVLIAWLVQVSREHRKTRMKLIDANIRVASLVKANHQLRVELELARASRRVDDRQEGA